MVRGFFPNHLSTVGTPVGRASVLCSRPERGVWASPVFGAAVVAGGSISFREIMGGRHVGQLRRTGQCFHWRCCLPGVLGWAVIDHPCGSSLPERGALFLSLGTPWQASFPIEAVSYTHLRAHETRH